MLPNYPILTVSLGLTGSAVPFPPTSLRLSVAEAEIVIRQLLEVLRRAGLVEPVSEGKGGEVRDTKFRRRP